MNDHTASTDVDASTATDATTDGHPAGDVRLRRPRTTGLRVAFLLGMTAIASANAAQWTTISAPGGPAA